MTRTHKWLLLGIIVLAIAFRFYQIASMPGGLFPDEAANGLDINLMEQGQLQPFYERGNGREALFFYMEWASVAAFGKGPWQHHVVSALVGVLAVLGCFLVTRSLFSLWINENDADPGQQKRQRLRAIHIALLAAFIMAVNSWHVVLSRTAFRANLIPLFTSFTFYFFLESYASSTLKRRLWFSLLTGIFFALGFYTYIAYRVMAPLVFMAVLWPLLASFTKLPRMAAVKKFFVPVITFVLAFIIFIFPIAKYFYTHPGSFIGRSGQVSIFNPELNQGNLPGTFIEVTKESMLAFFTHGDLNWRHNISGYPFLSPIVSPFFAIGLIAVLWMGIRYFFAPRKKAHYWVYYLLAGWFFSMLLPVVTTAEGIPHGLRSVGMIPPVFIITAFALYSIVAYCAQWVVKKQQQWNLAEWKFTLVKRAYIIAGIAFILALIFQTYFLYFVYAANSPDNFYSFRSDLTVVSQYLNDRYAQGKGDEHNTYLVLDKFSVQTTDYITALDGAHPDNPINQPYTQVDPEDSWKLTGLKAGDQIVFCQSSLFDTRKFKEYRPEAHLLSEARNKFDQTVMAIYEIK